MFSSIGWGEIFFVLIIGLIVIGPERLPGVVQDVRAAIYAARKAINNAKKELEADAGLEEFAELRKPFSAVTEYAALGPKRAMAKVLFDDSADAADTGANAANTAPPTVPDRPSGPRPSAPGNTSAPGLRESRSPQGEEGAGGFSWADIT